MERFLIWSLPSPPSLDRPEVSRLSAFHLHEMKDYRANNLVSTIQDTSNITSIKNRLQPFSSL